MKCFDCGGDITIPGDVMVGEIVECADCGLELEVERIEGCEIDVKRFAMEKEDWGE